VSIAAELIQLRWGGAGQALTDTDGRIRITAAGEDRQVASRIAIAATLEIKDAAVAAARLLTPGSARPKAMAPYNRNADQRWPGRHEMTAFLRRSNGDCAISADPRK
jgi:hypothetical protein